MIRACVCIFLLFFPVASRPVPFAAPFILTFLETSSVWVGRHLITRYMTKKVASGVVGAAIGVTSMAALEQYVQKRAREDIASNYGRLMDEESRRRGVRFQSMTAAYNKQDYYAYVEDADLSGVAPETPVVAPAYYDASGNKMSANTAVSQRATVKHEIMSLSDAMSYHHQNAEFFMSPEENTRRVIDVMRYDKGNHEFIFKFTDYKPYYSQTKVNDGTYRLPLRRFDEEAFTKSLTETVIKRSTTDGEIPIHYLYQDNGTLTSQRPHPMLLDNSVVSSSNSIEFTRLYEEKLPSGREYPDFTDSIYREAALQVGTSQRSTNPDVNHLTDFFYPKLLSITTTSLEDYTPAPPVGAGTTTGTGTNAGTGPVAGSGAQAGTGTGTGTATGTGTSAQPGTATNAGAGSVSGSASIPVSQSASGSQTLPAGAVLNLHVDVSGVERRIDMTNDYLHGMTTAAIPEQGLKSVDLQQLRSFWHSSYEGGVQGVFDDFYEKFKASGFYDFLDSFRLNFSSGQPPAWDINFNLGFIDFGTQRIEPPAYIWAMIRALMMFSALIVARRLVFGG